jgi:hypothetical protein
MEGLLDNQADVSIMHLSMLEDNKPSNIFPSLCKQANKGKHAELCRGGRQVPIMYVPCRCLMYTYLTVIYGSSM